jgi:GNAT superfamily N-acetyltransferase
MTATAMPSAAAFRAPAERALPDDLAALVNDLRSPDPRVRDEGAYSTLATRISQGRADGHLVALGDAGAALLVDPAIQSRSFGALLLALVVDRINSLSSGIPEGGSAEVVRPIDFVRWLAVFLSWYSGEQDLMGHDQTLGWLHAVAHGADTLAAFGGSRLLNTSEQVMLLDVTAQRLHTPTAHHLTQQEDDRLGLAVMTILARGSVPADDMCAWIDRLAEPWRDRAGGETSAQLDNTIRFARTLHLQLTLGIRLEPNGPVLPIPEKDELLHHLGAALSEVGWLYGSPS